MNEKPQKPLELEAAACFARRRKSFPPQLLDIRTPDAFDKEHLAGAKNIPPAQWGQFLEEIQPLSQLIFIDETGSERARQAAQWARGMGFPSACFVTGGHQALMAQLAAEAEVLSKLPLPAWKERLETLFDQEIRPILQADGGGAEITNITPEQLQIRYLGACISCSGGKEGTKKLIQGCIQNWLNHDFEIEVLV